MGTAKRERQKANRQLRLEQIAKETRRSKQKKRLITIGIAVPVVVAALWGIVLLTTGDDDDTTAPVTTEAPDATDVPDTTEAPGEFVYGSGECAPEEKPAEPVREFTDAPQLCIDTAKTYTATFETNKGTIVVELADDTVPGTVNNFVTLARYGYYDGTPIFRADPSIDIIQGGGEDNTSSPGYTIPDEANGFTYSEGDLSMARTVEPDSAGAQWFFVGGPKASALDAQGTYVTFGRVTEGLDVVKAILALAGSDGQTPTEDVTISTVEITES